MDTARFGRTGNRRTDEELDFIPSTMLTAGISSDIKYRFGQDGAEEAEE
jgi:hypothetical protein